MKHVQIAAFALLAVAGAVLAGEPVAAPAHPSLQPLNDSELRAVTRPLPWRLAGAPSPVSTPLRARIPLYGPGDSIIAHLHALNLLTADIEIKDVVYNGTQTGIALRDGAFRLPLPATIGEIDIRNIRCGPNDSLSFGSIQMTGIDLQNTAITVSRNR